MLRYDSDDSTEKRFALYMIYCISIGYVTGSILILAVIGGSDLIKPLLHEDWLSAVGYMIFMLICGLSFYLTMLGTALLINWAIAYRENLAREREFDIYVNT